MDFSLLKMYRKTFNENFIGKRSTYLSDIDQLAAIQLSVLMLQKQVPSKRIPSSSELFYLQKLLVDRKTSNVTLNQHFSSASSVSGILEEFTFHEIFEAYENFRSECNMIDKADVNMFLQKVMPETSSQKLKDVILSPVTQSPANPAQLQLSRIIIGYMQLLVNSRDEIALARVIDAPSRGINHQAFTDIRKLGCCKKMPMYQVISSFVRQIILAGKGYAPDENHVLYQHREGLVDFIDLMDKLQTVVDETENFKKIISSILKIIKTSFVRCKSPMFSSEIVAAVTQNIWQRMIDYNQVQSENYEQGVLSLRNFLDYVNCLNGNHIGIDSSQLCGILSTPLESKVSFKRISTLVTRFQTPDITCETPRKVRVLEENLIDHNTKETSDDDDHPSSVTPVQLIRCHKVTDTQMPTPDISENHLITDDADKQRPTKRRKGAGKKVSKRLKLAPGQRTLTYFLQKKV